MTHCRQALVVLAASLFIAPLVSTSPAGAASHPAHHGVVIDSTPYQSVQQLLGNTQIMVVARVESETRDRSAFQPASLVTVHVHHVLRGSVGKHLVVVQPHASKPHAGKATQVALQSGRTYLLLLDRSPGESTFFLVGGTAGEFLYDGTTKRFTRQDTAASWENSDFPLSLAEAGASAMPQTTQPSWLAPGGSAGPQAVSWSAMANDLGISPTDVACPSENLCLFAGDVAPTSPGMVIPAVAVSTGPFRPHANIVGTTTSFLPTSDYSQSSVACAGAGLCVFSSSDGVYVSTDPATGHWTLDVAPSPAYNFGQVSCPTASFCAVASGEGVLVSGSPSAGPTAWAYIRIGPLGRAISCPSPQLCVAGGYGNETVGGWIATSTSPLAAVSWHGGPTPHPAFAQHSGQYGVTRDLLSDDRLLHRGHRGRRSPCFDQPGRRRKDLDRSGSYQCPPGYSRVRALHASRAVRRERRRILHGAGWGTRSWDNWLSAAGGELRVVKLLRDCCRPATRGYGRCCLARTAAAVQYREAAVEPAAMY